MGPNAKQLVSAWLRRCPPLVFLLRMAARVLAPRQHVGAVGVVFNDGGQVLLVEHVFRTDFPWGLPGGWVERGEEPSETVRREIQEELKLQVEVKELLLSRQVGVLRNSGHPRHLGLAYYCRLVGGEPAVTSEILSIEWCDPAKLSHEVAPFQMSAALLGRKAFEREHRGAG